MTAHCVLISISMIISDVEHLLAIYITSLEKYLFKSSINFLIFFFHIELYELFVYFGD